MATSASRSPDADVGMSPPTEAARDLAPAQMAAALSP